MNLKRGLKDSPQLNPIVIPEISKVNRTKGTLGMQNLVIGEGTLFSHFFSENNVHVFNQN